MAAHKIDAMAAIARADVGFSVRGQCCGSDRIGITRCRRRRRRRDGNRLLGRRCLGTYRDCANGLRQVGKLLGDRRSRRAVYGFRQHSKVVRERVRRRQQIRLFCRLTCLPRRLGVRFGPIVKCYECRKRESGHNRTKYCLRGSHHTRTSPQGAAPACNISLQRAVRTRRFSYGSQSAFDLRPQQLGAPRAAGTWRDCGSTQRCEREGTGGEAPAVTRGPIAGREMSGRELRKSQVRRPTALAARRKGHGSDVVR
jgi:hypothetical protein